MKKIIALAAAALLMCCCAFAQAEDAVTAEEIDGFRNMLVAEALKRGSVEPEATGDGWFLYEFEGITLIAEESALDENANVRYAELWGGEALTDGRGIGPGSTLRELLAAYPLDNPSLAGSYEEAVLYISGMLPDAVSVGSVNRDGSHAVQVEYALTVPDGEEAVQSYIGYSMENNVVVGMYTGTARVSLDDARMDIESMSRLQEVREYSVYNAETPEPLAREDLLFTSPYGVVDFVSAGEDELKAALGEPDADNWEQDQDLYFRTMEWEGVTAVLAYDAQKQNSVLTGLQVYGDQLEGPRGLHMDDTVESVEARFPQDAGEALGERDEAGANSRLAAAGNEPYIEYTVTLDDGTVALDLEFVDGALFVITCIHK